MVAERLFQNLSAEYLDYAGVLPLSHADGLLMLATWQKSVDVQVLDELLILAHVDNFQLVEADESEVRDAIHRVYGRDAVTAEELIKELPPEHNITQEGSSNLPLDDLRAMANEAPVVRLVNLLLLEALEARASDVHLESSAHSMVVRYRIDGVLQPAASPPGNLKYAVVSRLKIMAELDIAERRLPQDGRIRLKLQNRDVDVRVSTIPTLHGESVVLRLLDRAQRPMALDLLGMGVDTYDALLSALQRPHGMVLVTGPTGSGKTTTLYAAVEKLRTGRENIMTVEDPVEYELEGVNQISVNPRIGLSFGTTLRALLRQDPDILLIGEIRDPETAQIAVQAALTGHLVLSTLHTNDAVSAVTRLFDLGVPDYLVTSTLELVLAQRLVRHVCQHCAEQVDNCWHDWDDGAIKPFVRGPGCAACRGTGYRGRTGIYELLRITDATRQLIRRGVAAQDLHLRAMETGMRTLRADGARVIAERRTTPEEVLRVTA